MSILPYPDTINAPDLQIWNNAAFDDGDSEDLATIRASWSPLKPTLVNRPESLEADSSKENQSPAMRKSPLSTKSQVAVKPLRPNGATGILQNKLIKPLSKQGLLATPSAVLKNENEEVCHERNFDVEIESIEMEISRLSSRLKELRLEKIEHDVKAIERRGRIVSAKFMEQKQSVKNPTAVKKIEEPMSNSRRFQRRGMSMGPSEIISGGRRGLSMGPSEIVAGVRSRQSSKIEITPAQPIKNRRKSCFWKLQDIDEGKVTKERGMSLTVGSQKTMSKIQCPKQAATTVGLKKHAKKEDGVLSSIQPRKLFKDGDKSAPAKKPLKSGRVVASRYNTSSQSTANSALRKRSLPENEKDDCKTFGRKRSMSVGKYRHTSQEICRDLATDGRLKKRWDIPCEVVIHSSVGDDEFPSSISKVAELLPKIRIGRGNFESPRDSGQAKRVSELIGRKSFFCQDDDDDEEQGEPLVCQTLNFEAVEK